MSAPSLEAHRMQAAMHRSYRLCALFLFLGSFFMLRMAMAQEIGPGLWVGQLSVSAGQSQR